MIVGPVYAVRTAQGSNAAGGYRQAIVSAGRWSGLYSLRWPPLLKSHMERIYIDTGGVLCNE